MSESRRAQEAQIRVLVAEDNADLRAVLAALIDAENDQQCVGVVTRAGEVWPQARATMADVIVLDLELAGESSVPIMRQRPSDIDARVVVFSGHDQPALIERVQAAGASAYVVKNGDVDALLAAIRRCAAR